MNCTNHPEKEANGACVYCGKFFCSECLVEVNGKNYCRDCVSKAFNEQANNNSANVTPNININNVSTSSATANNNYANGIAVSPKSRTIAALLCFFLGVFGVHRFYAGKVGMGILYFCTGGLCGIGAFVDFILILMGSFRDANGMFIKNW